MGCHGNHIHSQNHISCVYNLHMIYLLNDSIKLCLYEVPDMSPGGGIAHFGFHVDNFSKVITKCKALGVPILYGGEVDWEKSRSVYILDPSGYEIELSEVSGGGL